MVSDPEGLTPKPIGRRSCRIGRRRRYRARCGSTRATTSSWPSTASSPAIPCRAWRQRRASCAGTRWRQSRSPRASRSLKFGQIIGFATEPIAPGDWVHAHNCSFMPSSTATTPSPRMRAEEILRRSRQQRDLPGLPPRQRQGRHAQLYRHPHQRELLGLGGPLHRGGGRRAPASWTIIPTSTASCRLCMAMAAAWTARAKASRC